MFFVLLQIGPNQNSNSGSENPFPYAQDLTFKCGTTRVVLSGFFFRLEAHPLESSMGKSLAQVQEGGLEAGQLHLQRA